MIVFQVMGVADEGRIRVDFTVKQEPDLADIQHKEKALMLQYVPGWMVGQKLSISSHLVAKITGSYRISNGQGDAKTNIGLNLKSNVKGEEVSTEEWKFCRFSRNFPEIF